MSHGEKRCVGHARSMGLGGPKRIWDDNIKITLKKQEGLDRMFLIQDIF
jgi:hypothetical protein